MTVLELKSMVYLLPEVAWPIIKQTVANTGNHLHTVTWQGFVYHCEYFFIFMSLPFRLSVTKLAKL